MIIIVERIDNWFKQITTKIMRNLRSEVPNISNYRYLIGVTRIMRENLASLHNIYYTQFFKERRKRSQYLSILKIVRRNLDFYLRPLKYFLLPCS